MPEPSPLPSETLPPPAARRRFGWPLRLLVGFLLFDMIFHSLASLSNYGDWCDELEIRTFPLRLPTFAEMDKLADGAEAGETDPVADRLLESADSVWAYFKPWPAKATREKLEDWEDGGRYAVCWLTTRLSFFEHLVGINQYWTMFSPSVLKVKKVARAELVYKDGSHRQVRLRTADPEDLTHYTTWFTDRLNDFETGILTDNEFRLGYCNWLANHYRTSKKGSPLEKIFIREVTYQLPGPDEDAAAVLQGQSGDRAKVGPPFYVAEVKTRPDGSVYVEGRKIDKK